MGMKRVLKHQDLQLFDFVAKHNFKWAKIKIIELNLLKTH